MAPEFLLRKAARIIETGGVVTYPTEGVFGLGCRPDDHDAVFRILDIKHRDPSQGLILIASQREQLDPWVDTSAPLSGEPGKAITWIAPASAAVPDWIRGRHPGVAVRLSEHPVAASLCRLSGSALVSTSANVSGRPTTRSRHVLRRQFRDLVDCIVPGDCGPAEGPSEIRDLHSGKILRPASE